MYNVSSFILLNLLSLYMSIQTSFSMEKKDQQQEGNSFISHAQKRKRAYATREGLQLKPGTYQLASQALSTYFF